MCFLQSQRGRAGKHNGAMSTTLTPYPVLRLLAWLPGLLLWGPPWLPQHCCKLPPLPTVSAFSASVIWVLTLPVSLSQKPTQLPFLVGTPHCLWMLGPAPFPSLPVFREGPGEPETMDTSCAQRRGPQRRVCGGCLEGGPGVPWKPALCSGPSWVTSLPKGGRCWG